MSHCLRPRQIINPHFNPKTTLGAKNLRVWRVANNSPQGYPEDYQILIGCGKCLGCLRDKARSWRVRLLHEHMFGNHDFCTCLTLTIAPEYYEQFQTKAGMASAMRAFIDRLRYYTPGRRSPKRFFIQKLEQKSIALLNEGNYIESYKIIEESDYVKLSNIVTGKQIGRAHV